MGLLISREVLQELGEIKAIIPVDTLDELRPGDNIIVREIDKQEGTRIKEHQYKLIMNTQYQAEKGQKVIQISRGQMTMVDDPPTLTPEITGPVQLYSKQISEKDVEEGAIYKVYYKA